MHSCTIVNMGLLSSALLLMAHAFTIGGVNGNQTREMTMGNVDGQSGYDGMTIHPYCNRQERLVGTEGSISPGFQLHQVHTILTPGETVNLSSHLSMTSPTTGCHPPSSKTSDKINSLVETLHIYKTVQHDRASFKTMFPKFSPVCTDNELTSSGYSQVVSLGEHIHHSYFTHNLRLSSADIHVESSISQSAYASTLAFLHGLLTEKTFSKIVVRKTLDSLCHPEKSNVSSCHCGKVEELRPFVDQALWRGRHMFKDVIPQKEQLDELFGKVLQASALELLEVLTPSYCSGYDNVCFHGNGCVHLSHHSISSLHDIATTFLQHQHTDSTLKQFVYLKTYPFLSRLFTEKQQNKFLNVYMVDRQFLQLLQRSLSIHEEVMPLASRLIIEVMRSEDPVKRGALYIRVVHNGRDVTSEVVNCNENLQAGLCPLTSLHPWMNQLQDMYENQC